MRQLTKDEAIALSDSGWWTGAPAKDVAAFQLEQHKLCMPFGEFHRVLTEALGRPVWTHEMTDADRLLQELGGHRPRATWDDIMGAIPAAKRVVVAAPGEPGEPGEGRGAGDATERSE